MGRTKGSADKQPRHKYTEEEIEFLRNNYKIYPQPELLEIFNKHFNSNITKGALKAVLKAKGCYSGRTGQWQKGNVPHTKGLKWDDYMSKEAQANSRKTCFSSKDRSINKANHNEIPIGAERVRNDGYIAVRVATPNSNKGDRFWRFKHHIIWEEAHGPIPKGYVVMFADGNKRNFDLDNLILASRAEVAAINKLKGVIKGKPELTKMIHKIVKVNLKIKEVLDAKKHTT